MTTARKTRKKAEVPLETPKALSIFNAWSGVFTHAKIADNRLYLAAHTATFSAPFEGPDCQPDLERFVRAVKALPGAHRGLSSDGAFLVVTDGGQTVVKVPLHDQPIGLFAMSDGEVSPWNRPLLPVLATLRPFLVADTVTPWKGAIAFFEGFASVCTGSTIVQIWTGADLRKGALTVLPLATVDALLAHGAEPTEITVTDHGARFSFADGSTLQTALYEPVFPDLSPVWPQREGLATVGGLSEAVATVRKISTADLVRIEDGRVTDHRLEGLSAEVSVFVEGLAGKGFFVNAATLSDVLKIATTIKFCDDGKCYFEGAKLRGLVMCGR